MHLVPMCTHVQVWTLDASLSLGGVPLLDGLHSMPIVGIIFIWNLVWFLCTDFVKVAVYQALDNAHVNRKQLEPSLVAADAASLTVPLVSSV